MMTSTNNPPMFLSGDGGSGGTTTTTTKTGLGKGKRKTTGSKPPSSPDSSKMNDPNPKPGLGPKKRT